MMTDLNHQYDELHPEPICTTIKTNCNSHHIITTTKKKKKKKKKGKEKEKKKKKS